VLIFEPLAAPEQQVDQNYLAAAPADAGISVLVSCHSLVLERRCRHIRYAQHVEVEKILVRDISMISINSDDMKQRGV
jgi:hypothetical protein